MTPTGPNPPWALSIFTSHNSAFWIHPLILNCLSDETLHDSNRSSTARAQFVFTSYNNDNWIQPPVLCDEMLHDSNRSQFTSDALPFYFILYAYLIQATVQGRVSPSSTPNGEISSVYPSPIYHGNRPL
jgi:hypothetical protein